LIVKLGNRPRNRIRNTEIHSAKIHSSENQKTEIENTENQNTEINNPEDDLPILKSRTAKIPNAKPPKRPKHGKGHLEFDSN